MNYSSFTTFELQFHCFIMKYYHDITGKWPFTKSQFDFITLKPMLVQKNILIYQVIWYKYNIFVIMNQYIYIYIHLSLNYLWDFRCIVGIILFLIYVMYLQRVLYIYIVYIFICQTITQAVKAKQYVNCDGGDQVSIFGMAGTLNTYGCKVSFLYNLW